MSAKVFTRLIVERGDGLFMVYRETEEMFTRNERERTRDRRRVPESGIDRECSLADLLRPDDYMVFDLAVRGAGGGR